jgi:hypothetical protein
MSEWPKILKFTCPKTGSTFETAMWDSDHADEIFNWFFTNWGRNVPYSVD